MPLEDRDYMRKKRLDADVKPKRRAKRKSSGAERIRTILSWAMWIALAAGAYYWLR